MANGMLRCVPLGNRRRIWSITRHIFGVDRINTVVREAGCFDSPGLCRIVTRCVQVKNPCAAIVCKDRMTATVLRVHANEEYFIHRVFEAELTIEHYLAVQNSCRSAGWHALRYSEGRA